MLAPLPAGRQGCKHYRPLTEVDLLGGYRSELVNVSHALAVNCRVPLSRLVLSLTRTVFCPLAASTHSPPLSFE